MAGDACARQQSAGESGVHVRQPCNIAVRCVARVALASAAFAPVLSSLAALVPAGVCAVPPALQAVATRYQPCWSAIHEPWLQPLLIDTLRKTVQVHQERSAHRPLLQFCSYCATLPGS